MKKYIIAFILLASSLVAMDDNQLKKVVENKLEEQGVNLDNIDIITSSQNLPAHILEQKEKIKQNIKENIKQMEIVYTTFFDDIHERDVKASSHSSFSVRPPSYYIKNLLSSWDTTFKKYPDFKNTIHFTTQDYDQLDQKFADFYMQYKKDLSKTWVSFKNFFIEHFIQKMLHQVISYLD